MLNVGPRADGSLHPQQVEALEEMGTWLKANGESIYGTRPWIRFSDASENGAEVRYTSKDKSLYIIVTKLPANGIIALPVEVEGSVTLLETGDRLKVERSGGRISITVPVGSSIPVLKVS